jgi:hypothetical protein
MTMSTPDIPSLMSALPEGTIPPRYAPFLQLLGSMLKDDDEPEAPARSDQIARLQQRLRAQQRRLTHAQRVIRAYQGQNRLLARAHGACECWGGNPSCATCGGRGSARWAEPDRDLLRDLLGSSSLGFEPSNQPNEITPNNNPEERGR